jgi:hypothetical protein
MAGTVGSLLIPVLALIGSGGHSANMSAIVNFPHIDCRLTSASILVSAAGPIRSDRGRRGGQKDFSVSFPDRGRRAKTINDIFSSFAES